MNVCHLLENNPAEEVWKTLWGINEMRLNHELLKLDDMQEGWFYSFLYFCMCVKEDDTS